MIFLCDISLVFRYTKYLIFFLKPLDSAREEKCFRLLSRPVIIYSTVQGVNFRTMQPVAINTEMGPKVTEKDQKGPKKTQKRTEKTPIRTENIPKGTIMIPKRIHANT